MITRQKISIVVLAVAVISFIIYGYMNEVNNFTHKTYDGTIIGKYQDNGRSVYRYAIIRLPDGRQAQIQIDGYAYQQYDVGNHMIVSLREFDITHDPDPLIIVIIYFLIKWICIIMFILYVVYKGLIYLKFIKENDKK